MEQNVIEITLNKAGFEYDIHSLVKAFYPECEVRVHAEGEGEPGSSSDGYPDLSLQIGEEEIVLVLIQAEGGSSSFHAKKVVISDAPDRTEVKNRLKKLIYVALSEYTGKQLPWGTLTGIRPTKIPMTMLLEGRNEEEILSYMKDTYLVSEEKAGLSLEIAEREKELLSTIHYQDGYSLYIGLSLIHI